MEWRQWRWRSAVLLLATCGSLLAGSLLWCMHRRRRWSLILQAPPTSHRAVDQIDNSPGQSARLRAYSVSHHCIDVVDTLESCEATLHSQTPQSLRVVGLDCEWVSKERGGQFPVALLQLAFLDGRCLLVRMCKIQTLPPTLTDILQDNKILKFGVAIQNDARRLQTGCGVQVAGCVDLQHIAVRCGLRRSSLGLRGLAASLLGVELDKSWRLRCSDWEANTLSDQQVEYAASDAIVALDILQALLRIKMKGRSHRTVGAVNQLSHSHTELESEESLSNVLSAPVISRSDELNTQKDFLSSDSDSAGSSPGDEWTCDLAGNETSVVGSGSSLWRESSEEQGSEGEGSVGEGSVGEGSVEQGGVGQGSERQGSEGEGSVGQGSEGEGSAGQGSERQGSAGQGSERQGSGGRESLLEREAHSVLLSLCQGVVDVAYKQPKGAPNASTRSSGPQIKTLSVQPKRRLHAHSVRQTPLYHNCRLLAPDGSLLSVVEHKKIQWYLDRHLGTLVSETPPTVQLTFEPTGKPSKDREYYLVQKENVCVVCGSDRDCIRKNIVPQEYRRLFPANLKDHLSHDILLMCVSCHQQATLHSDQLKRQLAEEYAAPLTSTSNARFQQDRKLLRVKNLARALLSGHSIPESRRRELVTGVAEFWECEPECLTQDMIAQAADIDTRLRNVSYCPHAEQVVKKIRKTSGTAGLLEFQKRWRQHFLSCMEPRFLPDLWSVNHNPQR